MYCIKCGKVVPDEHSFCSGCGTKVVKEYKEKGTLIPLFCPKCGGKISVKEGQRIVDCEYCDYSFLFDDGVERKEITHIHEHNHYNIDFTLEQLESMLIDENDAIWEQKVLEQEHEYEMALLEEQKRERKIRFITFIVIGCAIAVLFVVLKLAL